MISPRTKTKSLWVLGYVFLGVACSSEPVSPIQICTPDQPCPTDQICHKGTCAPQPNCTAPAVACAIECCNSDQICEDSQCVARTETCNDQSVLCGVDCCPKTKECVQGRCEEVCAGQRCGVSQACCGTDEVCLGSGACCASNLECAGACCDEGQLCNAGTCEQDCGGAPPCGPAKICCAQNEMCYLEECIEPGINCTNTDCATQSSASTCPDGQFCDPVLGQCLPIRADADCTYEPPQGVFDPVPLFTWGVRRQRQCTADEDCQKAETCLTDTCTISWSHITPGTDDLPDYYQVTSIPMVVDLDRDCVPEIIFNTYRGSAFTRDGVMRAIRGDNGAKVWTVTDEMYRTNSTANPAVGDLDGDGRAEVIVQGQGNYLVAINSDGTPRWRSANYMGGGNSGSASIANLDGQGAAEIVYGRVVLDAEGQVIFQGDQGQGQGGIGPISCIADLDGDGRPEIIAGHTVYAFTGTVADGSFDGIVRWRSPGIPDGFCGIADFNEDQAPEIVLIARGNLYILQGQTGDVLAQHNIPGGGHGGAPNIADFDGDGRPDIGTAGARNYVVFQFNGVDTLQPIWEAPTEDDSSSRTGSSVFDFDGDGRNEVVYNDEEFVRIYPGVEPACLSSTSAPDCDGIMTDTEILFQDLNSSRTRTEYPVIADVNGDFKAEIVFATSNEATFLAPMYRGDAGIEVWKDRLDNWVSTRPVWNQHSFHITNVGLAGEIPQQELANWRYPADAPYNSYRRNTQGANNFCAPDLKISSFRIEERCPSLTVKLWVLNAGCLGVGPGVRVAIFDDVFGVVGSAQTQGSLIAGAAEELSITLQGYPELFDYEVRASVDNNGADVGTLNECLEDNNDSMRISGACQERP